MSTQDNIELQEKFRAAVNDNDLDSLDALVSPTNIEHDPAPSQAAGAQGYKDFFGQLRTAFPDLHIEPETVVAAAHDVAFAYTMTGTNTGEFMGNAATGKAVKIRGMQISRFADGQMVERWGSSDEAGLLKQLGLS